MLRTPGTDHVRITDTRYKTSIISSSFEKAIRRGQREPTPEPLEDRTNRGCQKTRLHPSESWHRVPQLDTAPGQTVTIDFVGPFYSDEPGEYKYILSITDHSGTIKDLTPTKTAMSRNVYRNEMFTGQCFEHSIFEFEFPITIKHELTYLCV